MKLQRYEVTFEGISPLLMHRFSEAKLEQIRTKKKPAKMASSLEPREEAQEYLYELKKGVYFIPAENFLSCSIEAGRHVRLEGKKMISTKNDTQLFAFFELEGGELILQHPNKKKKLSWEVDRRRAVNPNDGNPVCAIRPRFDNWSFTAIFVVDLDEIDIAKIRELLDKAGRRVGIGSFRPQKKGPYGRFQVKCWKEKEALPNAA